MGGGRGRARVYMQVVHQIEVFFYSERQDIKNSSSRLALGSNLPPPPLIPLYLIQTTSPHSSQTVERK